ncbi:MAG: asparagine synthase (glutamine-hydrolyzing) [Saprospiraceae bacterium]|nr:asparagine synthase (glutamine-hydrolyzing) [Saprospiraceae bacterium]
MSQPFDIPSLQRLLAARGPDQEGMLEEACFKALHCRLSIFDPREAAGQPMTRYGKSIVFNGAIYNHLELRSALEPRYEFLTNSDTEVILAAFDCWGHDCWRRLIGQWSVAIYNRHTETLSCARDRFGIKPFYYQTAGKTFRWASELRCFSHMASQGLDPDPQYVRDFLTGDLRLNERTPYAGLKVLPPGHCLDVDLTGSMHVHAYYQVPDAEPSFKGDFQDAMVQYRGLMTDAIAMRCRGDVPVSSTLSGGLDSAVIAGLLQQQLPDLSTFSIVSESRRYSEHPEIIQICRALNLQNTKIKITASQLISNWDVVEENQEMPVLSMSVLAQHHLYRSIKAHDRKVVLDGQGADEYLLGYDAFLRSFPLQLIWFPSLIARKWSRKTPVKLVDGHSEDIPYTPKTLLSQTVLPVLLHVLDRNSAGQGVEARVPYLDHRLIDFVQKLPRAYLMRWGRRKYLQRRAFTQHLPRSIRRKRSKQAFLTPQRPWIKSNEAQMESLVKKEEWRIREWTSLYKYSWKDLPAEQKWRLYAMARWLANGQF